MPFFNLFHKPYPVFTLREIEQGSEILSDMPGWVELRFAIPSASNFSQLARFELSNYSSFYVPFNPPQLNTSQPDFYSR